MNRDSADAQRRLSLELSSRTFLDIPELKNFLKSESVRYILEEDPIGKEAPKNNNIKWAKNDKMYYLILLPRNPEKLYRFKVYVASTNLYLEEDFAYRNPYQ